MTETIVILEDSTTVILLSVNDTVLSQDSNNQTFIQTNNYIIG